MAKELQAATDVPDITAYFHLFNTVGQVRDVVAPEWEAYATANIGDYDIAATEQGTSSGVYMADMPASIAAGTYSYYLRQQVGGSPAETDPIIAGPGLIQWDGSAVVTLTSRATQTSVDTVDDFLDTEIAAIKAKTDNLPSDPADASDIASSFSTVNSTLTTIAGYIDTEIATLLSRIGTPSDLGGGASLAANLVDIESQTDDIGAAGAGLSAIPWNASWDAEVQSEVQDAIEANNLDHLVKIAVDTNFATTVHLDSVIGQLADNGTTATYDRTTDSQEAIRDRGDAAWTTATGFSTLDAAGVRTAVGLATANLDTQLTTIDDFLDTEIAAIKAKTDNLPSDPADASDIAAAFSTVNTTLSTIAGYIDTEVSAIKAKTDQMVFTTANRLDVQVYGLQNDVITAASIATDAGTELATAFLDMANAIETGLTPRGAFRLMCADSAGKLSGAATTTIAIRNAVADSKARITATVDSDGNRTAITTDVT